MSPSQEIEKKSDDQEKVLNQTVEITKSTKVSSELKYIKDVEEKILTTSPNRHPSKEKRESDEMHDNNSFQNPDTSESDHRKRNYGETKRKKECSSEIKRSDTFEKERRRAHGRSRRAMDDGCDRENPRWERMPEIGGGYPSYSRDRPTEKRSVETTRRHKCKLVISRLFIAIHIYIIKLINCVAHHLVCRI